MFPHMRSTLLHNRINMLAWLCIRTKKVLTNLSHAPTLRVWPWQTTHQDYPGILLPPPDNCPNHRNYPWQPFPLSLTRLFTSKLHLFKLAKDLVHPYAPPPHAAVVPISFPFYGAELVRPRVLQYVGSPSIATNCYGHPSCPLLQVSGLCCTHQSL